MTSRFHVPQSLPELLLVAVAAVGVNWGPVKEVHDDLHHVSRNRHSQDHPLQRYTVHPAQKEHRQRVALHDQTARGTGFLAEL